VKTSSVAKGKAAPRAGAVKKAPQYNAQIDAEKLEQAQSAALKRSFEEWLANYDGSLRQRGLTAELSQERINALLSDFQLKHGLAAELQGMLDHLEPDDYTMLQLRNFYNANGRYFGGQVTISHILVQHRDGGTGILLNDEGIARANARIADIKARLRPDGSNFEEVARMFSDDTRTGREGGVLSGVKRFDDRLPTMLCHEAWRLRDGEISEEPIETQYGYHFVKRTGFNQNVFIRFTDDTAPSVRVVMQRAMQERRLLGSRELAKVQLRL
jgi:parvulin-like peptidyl-prolyl isomerase